MRSRPRRAMVLAAGRGTRLAPLTDERPKPLFPLGPHPILHYPLLMLRQAGIREVMVNLHHLGAQIRARFGDGESVGLSIRYSEEHPHLLGTGGGIKRARPFLDGEPFVVVNGDTLVDVDLEAVLAFHAENRAVATMVLTDARPGDAYGVVSVDADMRVRDIAGRAGWGGRPARHGHFCGIHVIEPRVFDAMPESEVFCINADVYPRLLASGEPVFGCFLAASFSDVGTPARYLGTTENLLDGTLRPGYLETSHGCGDPAAFEASPGAWVSNSARIDRGAVLKGPVYVGAGAVVEAGATLGPYTVLGSGARAGAGSHAAHTLVWEGAALARGDTVQEMVVTTRQRLQIARS